MYRTRSASHELVWETLRLAERVLERVRRAGWRSTTGIFYKIIILYIWRARCAKKKCWRPAGRFPNGTQIYILIISFSSGLRRAAPAKPHSCACWQPRTEQRNGSKHSTRAWPTERSRRNSWPTLPVSFRRK